MMVDKWYRDGKEFLESDIGDFLGFVYIITNKTNNRKYVGKKLFKFSRKKPPLKGKTRKRKETYGSDWKSYYGSNEELQEDVSKLGTENFHREILMLCKTKSEMSYYEIKVQLDKDVLLSEDYYNGFIGCRINGKHMRK
jgi:hypothetical protein